jgi:hypothetical protein
MKLWHVFLGTFLVTLPFAIYGCWISGNTYASHHPDVNPDYGLFEGVCEWIAAPGAIPAFLALDRTDIPENAPDPWQSAWLFAPGAALMWAFFFFGLLFVILCLERLFSPRQPSGIGSVKSLNP